MEQILGLFLPSDLADKLKELGFNEPCLAVWDSITHELFVRDAKSFYHDIDYAQMPSIFTWAPVWQQAFDWFANVHKINNFVTRSNSDDSWGFEVFRDDYSDCWECYYTTQDEARIACLEKLIELTKGK